MGSTEEIAPGYYASIVSKKEKQEQYRLDEGFLNEVLSHVEPSEAAVLLYPQILKQPKPKEALLTKKVVIGRRDT